MPTQGIRNSLILRHKKSDTMAQSCRFLGAKFKVYFIGKTAKVAIETFNVSNTTVKALIG